jgi:hypothetical protein
MPCSHFIRGYWGGLSKGSLVFYRKDWALVQVVEIRKAFPHLAMVAILEMDTSLDHNI